MFFVNKSNNDEVIELIYSGPGFCIVIDQEESLNSENPVGKIIKYGKKELKKHYRKLKNNHKYVKMEPISEEMKEYIIESFEVDKIGILEYTEDYIENQKFLDRQEEIQKQTEAERRRLMKELADDFDPNKL
jgi:hypothetical protein